MRSWVVLLLLLLLLDTPRLLKHGRRLTEARKVSNSIALRCSLWLFAPVDLTAAAVAAVTRAFLQVTCPAQPACLPDRC
jgi:hypothetical protein